MLTLIAAVIMIGFIMLAGSMLLVGDTYTPSEHRNPYPPETSLERAQRTVRMLDDLPDDHTEEEVT